ncbi:MAG: cation:proton antiporter [Planctomycetota bacterium]|jgi:Kef-type K+ transport system membrane component KefB
MHNETPLILIVGILTVSAYYSGRVVKHIKLPSLIGYMLTGLIFGPSVLGSITEHGMGSLEFINAVALGFVAFTIGSELSLKSLKKLGYGIIAVILAESFLAFAIVFAGIYLLTSDISMALIFAAMAPASAPAGTVAVIQEFKAKGRLTTALYAVVGFDDGLAIFIFGFAFAAAKSILEKEMTGSVQGLADTLLLPAKEIVLSIIAGTIAGFVFCFAVRKLTQKRDRFILTFGFIMIACGVSQCFHLSLILTNLVIGFILVNTRSQDLVHDIGSQNSNLMPLLFILFFGLAGAHLNLSALPSLGVLGFIYILCRSTGLIVGARVGAVIGKLDDVIKKNVGLGILSQAGVAIGLSLVVLSEFKQLGSEHALAIGTTVITTITATCIFFEIIGPILTKVALSRAGEINQQ